MYVRDLMSVLPSTVAPSTRVVEARRLMEQEHIRHLPVMDGERLVGIVTDRDIRLSFPPPAAHPTFWEIQSLLARLTVGEIMTRQVITVSPDQPAEDAARLMLDHRISALPVVEDGRLLGILTETDLLRGWLSGGRRA